MKEDYSNEFKVFRNPTFHEFYNIFKSAPRQDLPLFARLWYLREFLHFSEMHENRAFLPFIGIMTGASTLIYWFKKNVMYSKNAKLLSGYRIFGMFLALDFGYREFYI